MNTSELQKLIDWLIDGARSAANPALAMAEVCERLVKAGLPLWRVGIFVRTLHPDIFGRNFIWKPGAEVEVGTVDFGILDTPGFHTSPLSIVFAQGRRSGPAPTIPTAARFPIVEEMRAEGVTEYVALPLPFTDGAVNASSWTTKQPGGFTDEQLNALRSVLPPLTRYIEIVSLRRTAMMLLDTYVGNRAGEKIWGGQIRRGHTETDERRDLAVRFARLHLAVGPAAGRNHGRHPQPVLRLPGRGDPQHGGEVLKFMGDGLLAVFPIDEYVGDEQQVCSRVLEAARESRASVEALQYPVGDNVERFRFGVALHVGRILYGNIGGGSRLDFTCIGPAINLAARLEKLTGKLHRTVVASEGFAGICRAAGAISASFRLRDFRRHSASLGCSMKSGDRRGRLTPAHSSGSVVNSSG